MENLPTNAKSLDNLDAFGEPKTPEQIAEDQRLAKIAELGYDPDDMNDPNNPDGPFYKFEDAVIDLAQQTAKGRSKADKEQMMKFSASDIVQNYKREQQAKSSDTTGLATTTTQSNFTVIPLAQQQPFQPPNIPSVQQLEETVSSPKEFLINYYSKILNAVEADLKIVSQLIPNNHFTYLTSSFRGFLMSRLEELRKPPKQTWIDKL